MLKRVLLLTCAFLLLLTAACAGRGSYETISPEKAKELMDSGTDYILLDVRTQEEYDTGHIPCAVLLPDTEVAEQAEEFLPEKDALILVYCRSGRRSALASETLAKMGYTNVKDFGGIIDWPYEVIAPVAAPCEDGSHEWVEDCISRTCSLCGAYERVPP